MKAWLKGGLIVTSIVFALWAIILIFGFSTCSGENCMGPAIFLGIGFVAIPSIFIVTSLIVAIAHKILKSKGKSSSKAWKVGFWASLFLTFMISLTVFLIIDRGILVPGVFLSLLGTFIGIFLVATFITWLITKK